MQIQPFDGTLLPSLQQLVNLHLTAALPGWALSETAIARHLVRDDHQPLTDPWVDERATLCATARERVLAAAHLLRYGDRPEVGDFYRGVGTIAWVVGRPEWGDATAAVLVAARQRLVAWEVKQEYGWDTGLPAGPLWGVPDSWPHITTALLAAGYQPDPTFHREAVYGGWLAGVPLPGIAPVPSLTIQRAVGSFETRIAAFLAGEEVGWCDVQADLTQGGLSPALRGWAWLTDLQIRESWRNRGIGRWLVQHAAAWLRLAGCERIVLAVDSDSETAGADRFYQRFGWEVFVRETHRWMRTP